MRIYKNPDRQYFPNVDLLTFLFEEPYTQARENLEIHVEAANPENSITKRHARDLTQRIAHSLRSQFGIGANGAGKDVVIMMSSGQPALPMVYYGIIAAGGVSSGASTAFRIAELTRQIEQSQSKLLICSQEHRDVMCQAAARCKIPESRVLILDSSNPQWTLKTADKGKDIIGQQKLKWETIYDLVELERRPITILYSSGTTGPPKGVILTNRNHVTQAILHARTSLAYIKKERAQGREFALRTISHLPTAHIAGLHQFFINPFHMGGTVYWIPKYEFYDFINAAKEYKVNYFLTVPPIWLNLANSNEVTDHFKSMVAATTGAAPMGPELQSRAASKLGNGDVYIGQTWGLTETTGSVTESDWLDQDKTGSVGPLLPELYMRLVDDEGNDVDEGQPGEMAVYGPCVSPGYYRNEEATKASFKDGWFFTGDVGVHKDGLFWVVDRKKELIKYKGLQVAPAELEAHLISHPKILDAAVIGVEWENTEAPRAYCVVKDKLSEDEIKDFVKKEMASHKQLRGGVKIMDAIPKSASGKILRRELRDQAKKESSSQAKL